MPATGIAAARFLRHSEFELECNKQVAKDAFVEYEFGESGRGNLPAVLHAETGRTLSRWADAGWGHMIAADKVEGAVSG